MTRESFSTNAMVQLLFDGLPTQVLSGWPFILQPGIQSVKPYGAQRPAPTFQSGVVVNPKGLVKWRHKTAKRGHQKMGTQTGRWRDNFLSWRQSFSRDGWSPWLSHLYSKSMYIFTYCIYIHIHIANSKGYLAFTGKGFHGDQLQWTWIFRLGR